MQSNQWNLCFILSNAYCQFHMKNQERTAITAEWAEGWLAISMWFTFSETPLTLTGEARPGDEIRLVCLPHRIELYINDRLADEEWPCGEPLTIGAEMTECNVAMEHLPMSEPVIEPDVLGSFTGAEGWRPGNGVFVGDCMPYAHDGRYHVLYLKDRRHHKSKWRLGAHQWEHISSPDLIHWDIHPMAVAITDPMEGSICTGSWICEKGVHMLYYTVRKSDRSAATIQRSVSEDGWHFRKDPGFHFTLSDKYDLPSARDPKVVRGEDGLLHMFVTTSITADNVGALAHLTSEDGDAWTEQEPIYIAPDADQPECPDYFRYKGRYYLIFSHHGYAQYRISDEPFTGWRTPENPSIPCEAVPKAAIWNDRIIFTGFNRMNGYAGTLTFMEADAAEDGSLIFRPVPEMHD